MKIMTNLLTAGLALAALLNCGAQPASFKGEYSGLFLGRDNVGVIDPDRSGSFHLNVSTRGEVHGTFGIGNGRHNGSGEFDSQGHALFFIYVSRTKYQSGYPYVIQKTKKPRWLVTLDLVNGGEQVTGQILRVQPETWSADLFGNRAGFDGKTETAPQAGTYTVLIPGDEQSQTNPAGTGYGTIQIDSRGKLRFKGVLADGTKVSQGVLLGRNGQWPVCLRVYGDKGIIAGWVSFANQLDSDLAGQLEWIKPRQATGPLYPDGFTNAVGVVGSRYLAPPSGNPVFAWTNGNIVIGGGTLSTPLTNNITIGPGSQIAIGNGLINSLTLVVQPRSGLLSGDFAHPVTGKTVKFSGAILQEQNRAAGFFPDDHQSGFVRIAEQ